MDSSDAHRSALRQPFIDTANALASLYKQAAVAERDARDAGSRTAYQHIIQWAARKSRNAEPISASDVISFCATELAKIPQPSPVSTPVSAPVSAPVSVPVSNPADRTMHSPSNSPNTSLQARPPLPDPATTQDAQTVAYIARDDALVSDIKKLNVNPRKRQRVDISDTFVRACRDNENGFMFSPDHAYAMQSPDSAQSPFIMDSDAVGRQNNPTSRRESRDSRDPLISASNGEFTPSRKPKNPKAHLYDKLRRK